MSHSFVAAKLQWRLPTWIGNAHRALPSLTTKPFLALHLQLPSDKTLFRHQNLFFVSNQQPTSLGSEYFTLNQKESETNARTLTVIPPLPFRGPLYLSVTPSIFAGFEGARAYQQLVNAEKYRLDKASLERFLRALKKAGPSIPATRETGGDDEPARGWRTWSSDTPREFLPAVLAQDREVLFYFDLVPFESLPADLELHLFDELDLLRQLTLDYTWLGCSRTTGYVAYMREHLAASGQTFRSPVLPTRQPDPSVDALLPCTHYLQSLPVIHDGDPPSEEEYEFADDWKDEEDIDFLNSLMIPRAVPVPAVEAGNINVIVLDSNVLIDRDGPLQDALTCIFPPSQHQFAPKELLDLYVEHETLRAVDGQPDSPTAIVQEVARYLFVSVDESTIRTALEHHARPHLYPEASTVIASLIGRGYLLLILPSSSPNDLALLSQLPGLSCPPASSSGLHKLESFLQDNPTLRQSQILIVTSNTYCMAEPASIIGFPIALIKRASSRSVNLSTPTAPPTFSFTMLTELLQALKNPTLVPKSQDPVVKHIHPLMRIHDCYQERPMVRFWSLSPVFDGIQVHTGAHIAIKFEESSTTLPYEAAVYAQLKGVPGVPRIHWSGMERNSYVIVMDKLGPNLEELRSFCRGRFGLRTVLMLGEQMLSTIDAIHARGIIVRDIKPENFAMGFMEEYKQLHLLDFSLSKLWLYPMMGKHIPFRGGRDVVGTPRYASRNVHLGLEPSRRDDVEAIGFLLLYLLHGRLPWQGIYAPNIPAKLCRIGEMKAGKPFMNFLAHENTPKFFVEFFEHCRSLAFEEQPDYRMLRGLLRREFESRERCEYDWEYDWWTGNGERGTLLPEEYRLDPRLVEPVRHQQTSL